MTTLATLWALRRCAALSLPATEAALLMALADWTTPDGHCQPSPAALARTSGLGRSTLASIGAKLEARGLVRREVTGPTAATLWHLAVDEPFEVAAGDTTATASPAGVENGAQEGQRRPESLPPVPEPTPYATRDFQSALGGVPEPIPAAPISCDPPVSPSEAVTIILNALRVEPDPRVPLYWHRAEHRDDLRHVMAATGLSFHDLLLRCDKLPEGALPQPFRSLRQLVPLIAGGA